MNNEEKILAMLETMNTDLKDIKGRQANFESKLTDTQIDISVIDSNIKDIKGRLNNVETKVGSLETKVGNLETEMKDVKREVVKTNLTIENEIVKGIRLIAEGQKGLYDKVSDWKQEYDEMASTVLALDVLHLKK